MNKIELGVNIDHIATLRQARGTAYPDLLEAVRLVEDAGAHAITIHLREDRRHIQDADVYAIRQMCTRRLNLELAATDEMVGIACDVLPNDACVVPEKREELTTEGGLDVAGQLDKIRQATARLTAAGCQVSLFIDPEQRQIDAAIACGAPLIELHTGAYAEAQADAQQHELKRLQDAAAYASGRLIVNAGHGLHLHNVTPIAQIPNIYELNIGHALIADSVFVGLAQAVHDMKAKIQAARG